MECYKMLEVVKRLRKYFMSKTLLEQFLIIFSLLLFISFISVLMILACRTDSTETEKESTVCTTDACLKYGGTEDGTISCTTVTCIQYATNILEKMDPSIDACEDFYEFACGSYRKHHTLSGRKRAYKVEDDVESEIYAILRSLLASNTNFRSRSFRQAKAFYKCCMEGIDEFEGTGDLIQLILKTSDIQWSSITSDKEWKKAIVNMIFYGSFPFYDISLKIDDDVVTVKLLKPQEGTKQTLLSEPAFMYSTGEYRQMQNDYIDLIESTMHLAEKTLNTQRILDVEENCTNLHETAEKFFMLEKKLAMDDIPCSVTRLPFRKPSCSDMNDETKWVVALLNEVIWSDRYGYKLAVKCKCPMYVSMIEDQLKSKRHFRYYAVWRHLARFLPLISSSFRHSYMRLYEAMNPINKDITAQIETKYFNDKWKQCVHLANNIYGLAIAHIYKKEGYHEEDDEIVSLTESILKAYGEMFASQTSMDNETINYYLAKIEDLVIEINYPDIISDDFKLDEFYMEKSEYHNEGCNPVKQIRHPKSCFVYDLLNNECVRTKTGLLNTRHKKLNESSFVNIPPISSNIHVDFERSTLTLPAGILRFPYYTPNFFKFAKYGGISVLIVRELSRKIQAALSEEDYEASYDVMHNSEKDCLMQQYTENWKNIKELEMNLERNWEGILLDNIALKVAYELYQRDVENESDEPSLPNVDYNSDQLFFIHYAQMYCEIRNETFSIFDKSIPAKIRVNNVMMNKKEFSEAFECPEESPMNPSHKCPIWE